MEEIGKKRLTDNQRIILSSLLKKHDQMMVELISCTKDSSEMHGVSSKLTTNMDAKKKVIHYWARLRDACIKKGVLILAFDGAVELARSHIERIRPGQTRFSVRIDINSARCSFFYSMMNDAVNVNYDFNSRHPDA